MRFYEFAQTYLRTPPTSNVPAEKVTQFTSVPVIPDAKKRQNLQQLKAAEIARSANTIQPTQHDLEMAWYIYGQAQSRANKEFELQRKQQVNSQSSRSKLSAK